MTTPDAPPRRTEPHKAGSDLPFYVGLSVLGGFYVVLIAAALAANASFTTPGHLWAALRSPEIQYALKLSLFSSLVSSVLALWVAVPLGYGLSRMRGPEGHAAARAMRVCRALLDALLDIPIVLPPLVVGLSLLILFQTPAGRAIERGFDAVLVALTGRPMGITYAIPAVILAQFAVGAAFATRALRTTFDEIAPRQEQVALTLGCTRCQAFWRVVLPEARRGVLAAATLAWARSIGEFGPVLVFAGTTRFKTEVLPTSIFLELHTGQLERAVAVSLLMVVVACAVLIVVRLLGRDDPSRIVP